MLQYSNASSKPRMFYFGPWKEAGHYMRADPPVYDLEGRRWVNRFVYDNPWGLHVDGGLCPQDSETPGRAVLHHKDGWTVLAFWDRSVDTRPGSNSVYLAEGEFTFDQMVAMAKERFSFRWSKHRFEVTLLVSTDRRI